MRLKIYSKNENFLDKKRIISELNIDHISENICDFLLYVFFNYINLPGLEQEYYDKKLSPDANSVEICLNADAFLNTFGLSPLDYAEVEPGWYCLASRELVR